ncbi:hypothetical protein M9Y10_028987 [Tritrichomonas musculus]|uniref:Uncharacterized protein n=1 Tax=Tritrichomonas musculus TaxID=1915356 RepID=A0ABR2KMX5_9EUKA
MDLYKFGISPISNAIEKLDSEYYSSTMAPKKDIDITLQNLMLSMQNHDLDKILSLLKTLENHKTSEFTLQIVNFFKLIEVLMFLYSNSNEEIQIHAITVLNLVLNDQTIPYSMRFNIIFFLIQAINSGKQLIGFSAIKSLSKIATYSDEYHYKVLFYLAFLNVFQSNLIIGESQNKTEVTEYTIVKDELGNEIYTPFVEPGIQPQDTPKSIKDIEFETVLSYRFFRLHNYIKYTENQQTYICVPSLNLIISLLKYDIQPLIISFCFETLVSLIQFSNIDSLIVILKALCSITEKSKDLWRKTFQKTNPSSWIAPLFISNELQNSKQISQLLMLLVLNVAQKGEEIAGFPFNLLINKLQFIDEKSFIATCAASAIDFILQNDPSLIDTFFQLNLLPITLNVWQNTSFYVKAKIVGYLDTIAQIGCVHHKLKLIEMKFIFILSEFLGLSADEYLSYKTIIAIKELFECAKNQNQNLLKLCYQQIDDNIDSIREFEDHESKMISKASTKFINEFFEVNANDDNEYEYDYDDDDDDVPTFNF